MEEEEEEDIKDNKMKSSIKKSDKQKTVTFHEKSPSNKDKNEEEVDDTMRNLYNKYEDIFKEANIDHALFYDENEEKHKHKHKKKKVNIDEIIKQAVILKKLEYNNEFIFQKPRKLKRSDIKKLVNIQKVFKGFKTRSIESQIDRLRLRQCLLELFCLLVVGNYLRALKRKAFSIFAENFKDVVMEVNEEISFGDKINFRLPNVYYSGHLKNGLCDKEI